MGVFLIVAGVVLAIIGLVIYFSDKLPFLGRLPGDIIIRKENFTFYFPLATSIVLSIVISFLLYWVRKL